ncbi:aminotransferase class I/II-fold pyridoxal phosphate-dependent enzyme [Paenibacillus sp. NEAU-GSW1]|uniref:aminotransferase class I/II-fold pyridoxal phosphate-dependent enzyme n=1 Tax=Paenibacillus sp. NEAU-GSW1 TaxID=2682486 RepID=UPI0012E0F6F3|nr:aminotransferase class I/II-fold pyridoxal phosphate-dependent enzyme [Paenibacillus sp. NEAU-GSW1]MUT64766.1 aminotransferase class I/II-fold pyridoxal phosphate-dependent enzyme [Paenibacillus sp. NEAU-GSW1]
MGMHERDYVEDAFRTNWIAPLGANVDGFEQELADYAGAGGAVALSSGTAAIHMALRLIGIERGDRVFVSTLTFIASVNPILYEGGEPVFIDSDRDSWNMSATALEQAFEDAQLIGRMPKAVIVVNLYGQSADMDPINEICARYGVPVIEDAAESLGATYKNKASGTLSRFGIYSFNGNKIITTSGGGMLVSDDLEALAKARFYATQARDQALHYEHTQVGFNYRMSNILAGIGRGQLRVLDDRVNARREVFERYAKAFESLEGVAMMPEASYGRANRWLTAMTIDKHVTGLTPPELISRLNEANIEARPVWKPMHLQPLLRQYAYYRHSSEESVSDSLFEEGICLPSGSSLTQDEQDRVIDVIVGSLQQAKRAVAQ